jgi:hypothetical protein
MKEVNKTNFDKAVEYYLDEASKANYFFAHTLEDEKKYLKHNSVRYLNALKKISKIVTQENNRELQILEIGFSPMSFILKFFLDDAEHLTILDRDAHFKERIEKSGMGFIARDLTNYAEPSNKKYNIIIFNEVFEHIFCDETVLLESIVGLLRDKGYLLLSTPNCFSLKNLSFFLMRKRTAPLNKDILKTDGTAHIREYSMAEMLELFSSIKNSVVLDHRYERYFDNVSSLLVFRRNKFAAFFLIAPYVVVPAIIPSLRIGMSFILKKE